MDLGETAGSTGGDDRAPRPGAPSPATTAADAPAVSLARRTRGRPRAGWESLTPTEWEVVAQVATGRSNAEIGARLSVSPGTVRTHLRSVFTKLAVTSRTELTARAVADQPVPPAVQQL